MSKIITRKITTTVPKSETAAVRLKLLQDNSARIYVCRVAGVAMGTKENIHPQYGVSYGLVGTFAKINPDGSREDAAALWSNETLVLPIKAALDSGSTSVQFMADIWVVYAEKGATGFQYELETYGEEKTDPLAGLLGSAPAMPALPTTAAAAPVKGKKG